MDRIRVFGGARLYGEVRIGGSKNAALPVLFGGILTAQECVFYDLPRVGDVLRALEILRTLGARIRFFEGGEVTVDYAPVRPVFPPAAQTGEIRGSTYLLGAMLARFGEAMLGGFGGCNFGSRPIDQHLKGFARLGATISEGETVRVQAPNGLVGTRISLDMPSVGASANLMLAALGATGESEILGAAAEPHVVALGDFLTQAGAVINGVGSSRITVTGGRALHGVAYRMIPDMIEAGTYLCMGAACGGSVCVCNVIPAHLFALTQIFEKMGVPVRGGTDFLQVDAPERYVGVTVETAPYPGFPTDLHPQLAALLSLGGRAVGESEICERIWASRTRYTEGLRALGAEITVTGERIRITPALLHAGRVQAPDLRGGAALLLAALATGGESEITGAHAISRGYEHLEEKLTALGASVRVI